MKCHCQKNKENISTNWSNMRGFAREQNSLKFAKVVAPLKVFL